MGKINVAIIGVGNCSSSLVQGIQKYSEIQDDMDNNNILMNQVCKYMNSRCNNELLESKLNKILKHDKNWKPKKCLKYGLVTKII